MSDSTLKIIGVVALLVLIFRGKDIIAAMRDNEQMAGYAAALNDFGTVN